jgi:hypothetical protein
MNSVVKYTLLVLVLLGAGGSALQRLSASSKWVPYTDPNGGYSVRLPGAPHAASRFVEGPLGSVRVQFVAARAADGTGPYGVSYTDLPLSVLDSHQAALCMDAACDSLPGEPLGLQSITVLGHPGREFKVRREEGVTTVRLFLVGRRMYQLMATSPTAAQAAGTRAQFMESFQLLTKEKLDDLSGRGHSRLAAPQAEPHPPQRPRLAP